MNPPIIEVIAHDDASVTYRTRPCNYEPVHYGVVMATLIQYVAQMLAADNPKLDAQITEDEIVKHTLAALREKDHDESREPIRRLQ